METYQNRRIKERMAEANRHRQMTEDSQNALRTNIPAIRKYITSQRENKIPTVPLKLCEYDKSKKVLRLASEYFGMPLEFFVESHHTGKVVRFKVVDQYDVLYDQDGWDGEMRVYRPIGNILGVDHMYIYSQS